VTTYTYASLTGELVSVSHSDDTPGWEFTYNQLGQMTYVRNASGIRAFSYDAYPCFTVSSEQYARNAGGRNDAPGGRHIVSESFPVIGQDRGIIKIA
jgi:hypothetical protein